LHSRPLARGTITSVNVSRVVTEHFAGKPKRTAIGKLPVAHRVAVRGIRLDGDDQADRRFHGGPDRVAYAYGAEDYAWWSRELGRPITPGTFGENLTVAGFDVNASCPGERWTIGDDGLVLEVSLPRVPCSVLAARIGDPQFVKRFADAHRPGPYLRVVSEGTVGTGDSVTVTDRPDHGITVAEAARIHIFARDELASLLSAPQLGDEYMAWVAEQLASKR
jgi:MOSC domain-containing protein YiiM